MTTAPEVGKAASRSSASPASAARGAASIGSVAPAVERHQAAAAVRWEAPPVEDVRAPEVLQREAPHVHQTAEGEEREEDPCGDRVCLVFKWRVHHQRDVRFEGEDAAEPDSDRLTVVVAAAD